MANEETYFRPCSAIAPVLNIGSLAYGDTVETPYAHEEQLDEDTNHSKNTGLETRIN